MEGHISKHVFVKVCSLCRLSFRINNCVGEANQKYFVLFLFYTGQLFEGFLNSVFIKITLRMYYKQLSFLGKSHFTQQIS